MSIHSDIKKVTVETFKKMKASGEKISILTAYDYSIARLADEGGVEAILVGDSAANVMAGYETTLPITLDHMIYHAQSVSRALQRAMLIVDLPFGTYTANSSQAHDSAVRVMKESGAAAVKIEGGMEIQNSIKAILDAGIPVMGHLGLTPQSINQFGSFKLRAKEESEAEKLINDAKLLEELGCFSIVLEKIPAALGEKVSKEISIPTIGIGAGNKTDGQVLVIHDILGLNKNFKPKFARKYLNLHEQIVGAVSDYVNDVKNQSFPSSEESF
ncbi:3-methyl-2-oxobutanoate hydroxymethyltransferase [Apibacter raozihei]|uniref:3-methyl-2-oxobutanoate hydroxymethyltransferase n=1 Tax=Apibacter raozihei TaxID=2500547 RepID=UPI000FE40E10|nr:3-methyl-2-oxobutanoate hydroxymethyltransferase [Apibacter raozihei]